MSLAKRFLELFKGNERAHGVFNVSSGQRERDGKKQGVARVIKEPTTVELWEEHLEGRNGIGIIPIRDDNFCFFGAIDLDNYDMDHRALIRKLIKLEIPAIVCRSKSGGAHLYFFFTEAIDAALLQPKLTAISAYLGHGGSEVFPKQTHILVERGDTGNFINMPYHAGDLTVRYAYDSEGNSLTVVDFLDFAEAHRLSPERFLDLPTVRKEAAPALPEGPPCLQLLAAQGFGEGGRNNALFNLGVYAKLSDPDHWEQKIATYNLTYMVPPLDQREVEGIIKQLKKKEYYYTCDNQPIKSYCNKELCMSRKFGVGPTGKGTCTLSSLTKIDGDPPIWILNVDGQRVEVSTDALQFQSKFQRACIEQINKYPAPMKPIAWQVKMQELMENLTIVEVSQAAKHEGEFKDHLRSFCCRRGRGDELVELAMGISVWKDGYVYFQIKDLKKFLEANGFEYYSNTKITQLVKNMGGEETSWRSDIEETTYYVLKLPEGVFGEDGRQGTFDPIKLPEKKKAVF